MIRIADSQYYDLTWERVEQAFGDNPNWKNEIDLYTFLYEAMIEEGRDILEEFDVLISVFNAEGADRARFNQFQQMVLKSQQPGDIAPGREDEEDFIEMGLGEITPEIKLHSINTIDDLLKKSYSLNPTPEGTETDQSIGGGGAGKDYIDRQEKKKKFNPKEKPQGSKIINEAPPSGSSTVKYD